MNIRVLGAHNCESRDSRFVSLLIDDILALDAGSLTSSLSLADQQKLKAVLLTHHHYDHIRDIPALAMNFFLAGNTIDIYSTLPARDALTTHLLNNHLYPNFLERPEAKPAVKHTVIKPYHTTEIEGYHILAVPLKHAEGSVGYQVTAPDGKAVFYTGDAGPGMDDLGEHISPQLLITEVTVPNRYEEFARTSGHLTPNLLREALISLQKVRGYLPPVVTVHMNPALEDEIATEVAALAEDLNCPISLAYEGMKLSV